MLLQLYSDSGLLQGIHFQPGINVILGKYSQDKEKKGINGIGKSSLIRLIDYILLSKSAEERFLKPKYDFLREEKHNVVLELEINNSRFFIKRTFVKAEPIMFGTDLKTLEEFTKQEVKTILSKKFFPFQTEDVLFEGDRLGTLLDFFIKDDLHNQKRDEPTNFSSGTSSQTSRAIFNFFLYGLPTRNLILFEKLSSEYDSLNQTIKGLEKKIRLDTGKSIEEYKSERIKIEETIARLENNLKHYKFLEIYKEAEQELLDVTNQINEKLKEYHALSRKHKKIRDSFEYTHDLDLWQVRRLYNEAQLILGDLVVKKLEDVIEFKRDIVESRNRFLLERDLQIKKSIDEVLQDISVIEHKRSALYKVLDEKGALDSIENTYEQLTIEKTRLATNLLILNQIDELQDRMSELQVSIQKVKRDIGVDLKTNDHIVNALRRLFLEILANAIRVDNEVAQGHFDIAQRIDSARNQLPFKIEVEIPKADALGQSRLKIVAYDLMVFLKSIHDKKPAPDFLIHDGVYHGISMSTMVKSLNYIYHENLKHPHFQYIVTFNEDEFYVPIEKKDLMGEFEFNLDDAIIVQYIDTPSKMIFKRDFK